MKIDGVCHCGQVTYEAEIDSESVILCHCSDCQALSGAAYRTVAFTVEGVFDCSPGLSRPMLRLPKAGGSASKASVPTAAAQSMPPRWARDRRFMASASGPRANATN